MSESHSQFWLIRVIGVRAAALIPLLAIICLPACTLILSPEGSEEKVLSIRLQIANEQFDRVYDGASSQFKKKVRKEDFLKLLKDLPPEVGDAAKFNRTEGSANYDLNDGFHVILRYAPVVDSSIELEEYVFVKEDDEWKLFNYRIVKKRAGE